MRNRPDWRLCLCGCLCAVMLAACGGSSSNGTATPTTTTAAVISAVTPTSTPAKAVTPSVQLGPQPCPVAVSAASYWDAVIPTQPNVSKVESVTCGYLTGTPTLQALITVRYTGTGSMLDVYVYNNITAPNPSQLFKLQGLYKGDARISNYNTVLTAEVDLNSSVNKGQPQANLTQDLFREFATGSFAPVSFPGIFPDLTRFQAERDQAQVNQGQDSWKLSPEQVAAHFAISKQLLNWPDITASITSGGGSNDAQAVVSVTNNGPGGGNVTLTMQRLEGNTNGGIWEITQVASSGLSITTPASRDVLRSPVTISGSGSATGGTVGTVVILDHTLATLGQASAHGTNNGGATGFSSSVSYTSTFKAGYQDGIVALYILSATGSSYAGVVMEKELL
jgi:hypothetical protein